MHALLPLLAAVVVQDTATRAADAAGRAADSASVLTFDAFYAEVLADHPVVRQAQLLEDVGQAEILAAKGGVYDPTVSALWARKVVRGGRVLQLPRRGAQDPDAGRHRLQAGV